ncbi:MAG: hypothetical protein J6S14_06050 [Clostridia bacterium]|nr:hypothetical protein [Clostridia bacterium]
MKKVLSLFLTISLLLSLTSCGGVTLFSNVVYAESDLYTDEEIAAAMDEVKKNFKRIWKGCILLDISYKGDSILDIYNYKEYAEQYQADDVIVISIDFYVPSLASLPGFGDTFVVETNHKYEDWSCVLLRYDGGGWEYIGGGYP